MAGIRVSQAAEIIIGVVVIALLLSALTPVFMNSMTEFSTTISNYSSLSPIQPLVDNLPLIIMLSIVVGLVFAAIAIFRQQTGE